MIAIDTSAVIAILLAEPDKKEITQIWANAQGSMITAPTLLECHLVISKTSIKSAEIDTLLYEMHTHIMPFDMPLLAIAMEAFGRFGKGNHKAKLNFGDCMSYALAKYHHAPLLYKGDDFCHTDITLAQ